MERARRLDPGTQKRRTPRSWPASTGSGVGGDVTIKNSTETGTAVQASSPPAPSTAPAPVGPYLWTPEGFVWGRSSTDGPPTLVRLCNFTARIVCETVLDDGAALQKLLEIEGHVKGAGPRRFTIPAQEFEAMNWPIEHLGATANVFATRAYKDKVRDAIQRFSEGSVQRRVVFVHAGWRHLEDGRLVYLHGGGGIGASGLVQDVSVSLPEALAPCILPAPPTGAVLVEAVQASLELLNLGPATVTVPHVAAAWLAPLREAFATDKPTFTPWVHGGSGEFKTEFASLLQSHFGDFTPDRLPSSFRSTENAVERVLFDAKDMLLVVDDYRPTSDRGSRSAMDRVAECLLRGVGNSAARGRMTADGTLRREYRPRGLPFATAELMPPSGVSTAARAFVIPVPKGGIDPVKLTRAQAKRHLLAPAMAGFLQWIAQDMASLSLAGQFALFRDKARSEGQHRRSPAQIAHLFLGIWAFGNYARSAGALPLSCLNELLDRAWEALCAVGIEQASRVRLEQPVRVFLRLLRDGLAAESIHVKPLDGAVADDPGHKGSMVGWEDSKHLLLIPSAVKEFLKSPARGETFPIDWNSLLKALDDLGIIAVQSSGPTRKRTVPVRVGEQVHRLLRLRRSALDDEQDA